MPELSGEPAYRQVANDLRRQITSGKMATGSRLPSLAELTKIYGSSSTVIKAAINELRTDGLVVGQQGKGIYVRQPTDVAADADDAVRAITDQVQALRDEVRAVNQRLAAVEELVEQQGRTRAD